MKSKLLLYTSCKGWPVGAMWANFPPGLKQGSWSHSCWAHVTCPSDWLANRSALLNWCSQRKFSSKTKTNETPTPPPPATNNLATGRRRGRRHDSIEAFCTSFCQGDHVKAPLDWQEATAPPLAWLASLWKDTSLSCSAVCQISTSFGQFDICQTGGSLAMSGVSAGREEGDWRSRTRCRG